MKLLELIQKQKENKMLWETTFTTVGKELQVALKELHQAIEDNDLKTTSEILDSIEGETGNWSC